MRRTLIVPAVTALLFNAIALAPLVPSIASASTTTRLISAAGTATLSGTKAGSGAIQFPEIRGEPEGAMDLAKAAKRDVTNRSQSPKRAATGGSLPAAPATSASIVPGSGVDFTFKGLNHFDQRFGSGGGNQFSLEPPDQGLCVGNGYILETVNDVMRVTNTSGTNLLTQDLNSFYKYIPAIVRSTLTYGPFITDPSCYYDPDSGTWFHVVLTLDVVPSTGAFTGTSHLDLAVRHASSPIGTWKVYKINDENDGTLGQPNHHCIGGPCFGDYPHIGADAYGFYISTNEYSFFADQYTSANIYALSKSALAAGASSVPVQQLDTVGLDGGNPGFTIWPATSPAAIYDNGHAGTEYFLSSNAAEEANGGGSSTKLLVWALTHTSTLATTPAVHLSHATLSVSSYSLPPKSAQKAGNIPLANCLNDTTTTSPLWLGAGCWRAFFAAPDKPTKTEVLSHLDSNDTRMQQVFFADGLLWGALDTAVSVGGQVKAGIAWYVVDPAVTGNPGNVSASLVKSGTLAVAGTNLTYPAVAVLPSGEGALNFSVVGGSYYPSAAWTPIDASGVGDIHIISSGLGPSDGFTSYGAFVGFPPRTRWGDYGASAVAGGSIWMASESIEQTCTFATYLSTSFRCTNTRTALGNWATRISAVSP